MKRDSRLSTVLHALLHMAEMDGPATSESLAQAMQTNPVVVRRLMAGLEEEKLEIFFEVIDTMNENLDAILEGEE